MNLENLTMLKIEQVSAALGQGRSTTYRDLSERLLPAAVKYTERSARWPKHEIVQILKARAAGWTTQQLSELVIKMEADRKLVTV
jgi:prophage regulatory protein